MKVPFYHEHDEFDAIEDILVFAFAKLAKSNMLISAFHLSAHERQTFQQQILEARQCFLGLMNAAEKIKDGQNEQESSTSRRSSISSLSLNSLSGNSVMSDDVSQANTNQTQAQKLPNFHIGMHFERIMQEYALLWNANVLFGEDKHRFFKKAVLTTNNRKPARQVLLKEVILQTVKNLLNGSFSHTDPELSTQICRLQTQCPMLFTTPVSLTFESSDHLIDASPLLAESSTHLKPAVYNKFKRPYVQREGLPLRITHQTCSHFLNMFHNALTEYDVHALLLGTKFLYWYEKASFTIDSTGKRCSIRIGDVVQLKSNDFVQLQRIFTHRLQHDEMRRIFFWVRLLTKLSHRDDVLNLDLYTLTKTDRIVSLFSIKAEKPYMILIDHRFNASNSTVCQSSSNIDLDYLHCTWQINFL